MAMLSNFSGIRPGSTWTIAFKATIESGWHIPWNSSSPLQVTWSLPEGFHTGPIEAPLPARLADGPAHVDETWFLCRIRAPRSLTPGDVKIKALVEWNCRKNSETASGAKHLALTIPVDAELARLNQWGHPIGRALALIPRSHPDSHVEIKREDAHWSVALKVPPGWRGIPPGQLDVFVDHQGFSTPLRRPEIRASATGYEIRYPATESPQGTQAPVRFYMKGLPHPAIFQGRVPARDGSDPIGLSPHP